MANAFIGVPQGYNLASPLPAVEASAKYVGNDEPGLIFLSPSGTAQSTFNINLDSGSSVDALLFFMGRSANYRVDYFAATTAGNRDSGNWSFTGSHREGSLSSNRSQTDYFKYLVMFGGRRTERFWRIVVYFAENGTSTGFIEVQRMLFLRKIQPPDNIEVGAAIGIDDRSNRRYSRGGRRNIDPAGIFATFQGGWPWIDPALFKSDFRPLMRKRGGTYPVAFVFDADDKVWGEDEIFYGDLEKQQSITYEDGNLFSFAFSIVDIWPTG